MIVQCTIETETKENDNGTSIESTLARCSKCEHATESFGVSDQSMTKLNIAGIAGGEMPKVTTSTFCCPKCGSATKVLRTRSVGPSRLTRYRVCTSNSDHRFATREIPVTEPATPERAIGTTSIRFALLDLAAQLGITID